MGRYQEPPSGIDLYDKAKLEVDDISRSMDELREEEDLEEKESQICRLLQTLAQDREYEASALHHFRCDLWKELAALVVAYYKRLSGAGDPPLMLVNEFMTVSIGIAKSTFLSHNLVPLHIWYHGSLLWKMGLQIESILKSEEAIRYWLRLDSNFGYLSNGRISKLESIKSYIDTLQSALCASNEFRRALLWSERCHARDLLFLVTSEEGREKHANFDMDDEKAWLQVRDISTSMGKETAILVVSYFSSLSMSFGLASYLLHNGDLVGHARQWDFEACSPSTLLKLVEDNNADSALRDYYKMVIQPFELQLESIKPKKLIFVPSEDFCLVPYAALIDEDNQYLIEKYAVTTVTSLRLLQHCNERRQILELERQRQSPLSSLVVGNPTKDLLYATLEAEMVEAFLKRSNVDTIVNLRQGDATKDSVLRHLTESNWIHIASHGTDALPRFPDGALILAVPEQEQEQLNSSMHDSAEFEECLTRTFAAASESDILTGNEVVELARKTPFQASAAVLSACRSGRGRVFAEGILALPRSFHISGVPSVVTSLWNVNDRSTQVLMAKLYENLLQGMDIATALQDAVVQMIEANDGCEYLYKLEHWAPFVVSGTPFTTLV